MPINRISHPRDATTAPDVICIGGVGGNLAPDGKRFYTASQTKLQPSLPHDILEADLLEAIG